VPKTWKVGIVKDTSQPMLGLHGLHVACRGLPQVEVVALVDGNADRIHERMTATGAQRYYRELEEMLDRERPDIVILCSRHPADHFSQIRAAAERGVHIYCEKPMTADLDEAGRIVALAERHRIRICVAHPARYAAVFRTMKAMLDAGEIGRPLTAYGKGKCDHRGGGEDLMVLGTHILDLQACLFGPPQHVWAEVTAGGRPVARGDRIPTCEPIGPTAGDAVFATFAFPGGVRGVFESHRGWAVPGSEDVIMGLTVMGERGSLSLRFNDRARPVCELRISRQPVPPEDGSSYIPVPVHPTGVAGAEPLDPSLCGQPDIPQAPFFLEANRNALLDLMAAITEDRLPRSNVHTARTTLEMIYGVYAAHLDARRIPFPLVSRAHPLVM
jgi:predicted dehydrogenase